MISVRKNDNNLISKSQFYISNEQNRIRNKKNVMEELNLYKDLDIVPVFLFKDKGIDDNKYYFYRRIPKVFVKRQVKFISLIDIIYNEVLIVFSKYFKGLPVSKEVISKLTIRIFTSFKYLLCNILYLTSYKYFNKFLRQYKIDKSFTFNYSFSVIDIAFFNKISLPSNFSYLAEGRKNLDRYFILLYIITD